MDESEGSAPALDTTCKVVLRFVLSGSADRRAAKRPLPARRCAECTIGRWPAVMTTGSMRLSQPWQTDRAGSGQRVIAFVCGPAQR